MKSFKNIGTSGYRRITNEVVRFGETFTCVSEKEETIIADEGSIGIRLEEVEPQFGETVEWTAKMEPVDYLKRFPKGPQAALAREFLRRKELSAANAE